MIRSRIAQRYAKALFELAQEAGKTAEVADQLASVQEALSSQEDLRTALLSPILPRPAKAEVLEAVLASASFDRLAANFLRVLLGARQLPQLGDVLRAFSAMRDEADGRVRGQAATPMPLHDHQVLALRQALAKALSKDVELELHVDPSLLGGVVARVGNLVFDGSLRTQLERMRETLIKG
ncbi:MAG: ATP synthase F1 subunit delta [Deferrisomatales bacterium]|nr:ATP synthase F1 subunit delta [Deferrisomatales bacterium]